MACRHVEASPESKVELWVWPRRDTLVGAQARPQQMTSLGHRPPSPPDEHQVWPKNVDMLWVT